MGHIIQRYYCTQSTRIPWIWFLKNLAGRKMGQPNKELVSLAHMINSRWYFEGVMTRRDHRQILSQIQLFLVDEVFFCLDFPHIFNSFGRHQVHILNESRGSTLEVVMSRMKTRGSAVRFICVSATVPNIEDIASWIGDNKSSKQARVFQVAYDDTVVAVISDTSPNLVRRRVQAMQTGTRCLWLPEGKKSEWFRLWEFLEF